MKTVYGYLSYSTGYHVGYGHDGFDKFTFEWYNSRGLVDSLSQDVPNVETLTAVRKQAYYQLKKNRLLDSIDIVHYGSRKTVHRGFQKYVADYVGTVIYLGHNQMRWVDAEGKWYKLNDNGTLGTIIKTRHSKETPRMIEF